MAQPTIYNWNISKTDLIKIEKIQDQIDALCKKYADKYGLDDCGAYVSNVAECLLRASADLEELRENIPEQ